MPDKKSLSETDICTQFITPAIKKAGWDFTSQVRQEVTLTDGRITVRGKMTSRGARKRADYVLYHRPNMPIAVVEAKDNKQSIGAGMQQALGYADMLDVPYVFSSNGDGFLFHDKTAPTGSTEKQLAMDAFPDPSSLWQRYQDWKGLTPEHEPVVAEHYFSEGTGKSPRYYQQVAINRTIEAIARGQERLLLVMATGTGKTYTAFQIIWRLWKSRRVKRVLYLADRNILIDQTRTNDFKPFGNSMTKIQHRKVDKAYEIYLALYQAISGPEEEQNVFKEFSPDFFDLVIIDECHRGSAAEDAAWRAILDYFTGAIQIGMTATPKETEYISNIEYFGEPVFTYSLKQGIDDGFLAPYKVIRIDIDRDLVGWRPPAGAVDDLGQEIEDKEYTRADMDRILVLNQRTKLVASKVMEFLNGTDPFDKAIVFCEDIDHAERMRSAIVNAAGKLATDNAKYVMRITGDNPEGKMELDNFIDPEATYPVIATTSRLMSTGVDAKTCKLIVLDRAINSMTEFKQIIGRGTRVDEDYNKLFFTIMDFRGATNLFADPDFDGDPVQIYEPGSGDPVVPPDEPDITDTPPTSPPGNGDEGDDDDGEGGGPQKKYYVSGVEVRVLSERVQYLDPDGNLITESLKDYTKKAVGKTFASLDDFLRRWTEAEKKSAVIKEMEEQGVILAALAEDVGKDFGPFDLICHVAFDKPPVTRRQRAEKVRATAYFEKYGDQARAVLDGLLEKFSDEGIVDVEDLKVLQIDPFNRIGTPVEIVRAFGGRDGYVAAVRDLENQLYAVA
jgi:type I restriction enzyme, R subunit